LAAWALALPTKLEGQRDLDFFLRQAPRAGGPRRRGL